MATYAALTALSELVHCLKAWSLYWCANASGSESISQMIECWQCIQQLYNHVVLLDGPRIGHSAFKKWLTDPPCYLKSAAGRSPPLQITHSASAHGVFACRLFWPCWNLINTAVHGKVNGWLYSVMATETVEDAHLAQNAQWTLNRQLLTTHDDWLRAAGKDLSRTVPPAAMNDRRHHFGVMCQGHAPVPVCADHDKSTGAHCRPSHFRNRSSRYYSHSVGASN